MATNINNLNQKRENGGSDQSGVLLAKDWNTLVDAVIENQQAVQKAIKGITLNGVDHNTIDDRGYLSIRLSEGEYDLKVVPESTPPTVIAKGAPCVVKFAVEHLDLTSGEAQSASFPVTARFYCNGVLVGTVTDIYDKNYKETTNVTKVVEFDFAKYADLSTSESGNQLYIEIDNGYGYTKRSSVWITKVINMSVNVTFQGGVNNKLVFTKDNLPRLGVVITGNNGYLYATIDGDDFLTRVDMPTDAVYNIPVENFIPYNSHGVHELKIWATPRNQEDIRIEADTIKYIYGDNTVPTPVIMSTVQDGSSFEEYNRLNVEYVAYYAGEENIDTAELYISSKESKKVLLSQTQTVDFVDGAASGVCSFSLFPQGSDDLVGDNTLNIKLGDFIDTVNIKITRSDVTLESAEGWQVYLTSNNRTNNSDDKNVWECTNREGKTYGVTFDDTIEFLEAGSGWNPDSDKNIAMHLRKGKYFELDYKPFVENPVYNSGNNAGKGTGKTISIEFATRNCLRQDARVISCIDPDNGYGFEIFANKINVVSNNKTISCDFKEDERIKVDIVIEGAQQKYDYDTVLGTSGTVYKGSDMESLMIIFIDGVYQRLALIPANTTFVQKTPQNIRFGSDYCELDVYNIRMYDFALNIDRIVKNYAYDTPKFEDKIAIAKRNNIFTNVTNNRPSIDIQKLREARPDLPFWYVQMAEGQPALPKDKSNWLPLAKAAWVNPNSTDKKGDGSVSWETKYGAFRNQGTSSMNYPWPWRNWDFKLDKYKDASGQEQKGYFEIPTIGSGVTDKKWKQYNGMPGGIAKITLKKDYASSEMCNNAICSEIFTDMANGIGNKYSEVLSPTQQQNGGPSSDYRLTFKATPCFAFQTLADGTNDPMGMMNLIPNKNECEYLGFLENEWEDGEGKPRAQSWEVCENHIFWDFPIETILAEDDPEAETKGDKHGYFSAKMVQKIDENGDPMTDENGDPIMEQEKDENGELVWEYLGNFKNGIDGNYEARYPKDSSIWDDTDFGYTPKGKTDLTEAEYDKLINEQADIINFHNWLVSTNRYLANPNKRLDSDPNFVYEEWNVKANGDPQFEFDTAEYRLKKFENEAPQRMLVDQWLLYYIWREQFWMFDSGSKNLQLYTMDGTRWGCMVRDADTALGIDNVGVDRFPAHLEDVDFYSEANGEMTFHYNAANGKFSSNDISGKPVLNGQFGAMWLNLRDAFGARIGQMYRDLASNASQTHFNSNSAIERFQNHQANWCESLYNWGMRQYFGGTPFSMQINAGNGDKKNSRKSWLEKGFYYRNSKYNNLTDYFNFRGLTYKTNDSKSNNINIKTYIPMYVACGGSTSDMLSAPNKFRITDPNVGAFIPVATGGLNMPASKTDKNTYIFGSDNITDLGDFARHVKLDHIVFPVQGMQKLTSFKLGDHTDTYREVLDNGEIKLFSNDVLSTLNCNGLPALTYLDITRHSHINDFQFDKCTQLEEFYASGTDSITSLKFPQTTTLRVVRIGGGLRSLEMENLTGIQEFSYDGLSNIQLLSIKNCGSKLASDSYRMVRDSINSLELSHKDGTYERVCILHGINWASSSEDIIKRLVDINADLRGKIRMATLSYETKIKLMTAFGNIDDPNNSLYVTYDEVDVEGLTMPSKMYLFEIGSHQLVFTPDNPKGNNFIKTEWTLGNNAYATIDKSTGVVTLSSVGTEEAAPYAIATIAVTLTNGTVITAETEIHFYQRSCRLGDYVFDDGTYNDELLGGKTPVGICFYIDPKNKTNRLMVALRNITGSKTCYGLCGDNGYKGGVDDVVLEDNLSYNCYDIATITNITEKGIDHGSYMDPYKDLLSDAKYRAGDESDDYFTKFDIFSMYGDLGWQRTTHKIQIDKMQIAQGTYIPSGKYKTLAAIMHRNTILNSFRATDGGGWDIPAADEYYNEMDNLTILLRNAESTTGIVDREGRGRDYLLYYPAASYAYSYVPTSSTKLIDSFKEHNWFLPACGDAVRIMYHLSKTEGDDAIFAKAISDGKFTKPDTMITATECDSDGTSYCNSLGQVGSVSKSANGYEIRPICIF